jgi:glutamine cyclotransferase
MKRILFLLTSLIVLLFQACDSKKSPATITLLAPEVGTSVSSGSKFSIDLAFPEDSKPDSIIYLVDSTVAARKTDTTNIEVATEGLPMGTHLITAKVFKGGSSEDVTSNIVIIPGKAPEELGFVIVNTYPHDTSSYTEGLIYQDGVLYESDGGRLAEPAGQSSIRKTDLKTGKVLKVTNVDPNVFAEGITIVGDKIIQMTYTERTGYVYDKNSLKLLSTFNNKVGAEGWGMTSDNDKLYLDDSTNRLWFLDKQKYNQVGYVDVYDNAGPVNMINELEYIDGKIYANVYQTDNIIIIDPKTGVVLQKVDLSSIYPDRTKNNPGAEVLNGIAWDSKGKRLFVTGKKWDKLFEIRLVKK